MPTLKTIPNLLSHGAWRLRNDAPDLLPAAVRLSEFTARAIGVELKRRSVAKSQRFVTHAAIHTTGNNIGDMALPLVIRKVIDHEAGPQNWYQQPLWREIDREAIDFFNKKSSLMLVGGGGLLLPDDRYKTAGWQWNIPIENLRNLTNPLAIFAVGYNKFRGQNDFSSAFRDHMELVAEKSVFVGLRNTASADRLADYLSETARKKLRLQPCITTVLNRFYPTYKSHLRQPYAKELAINAAFDRAELRFGDSSSSMDVHIAKLVKVAKWAHEDGWKIHLTYHSFEDAYFAPYLEKEGIPFERHWLPRMDPEAVFDLYTKIPLVLGMRGHAQMIPYGLGSMILPVITHDKLVFFLKELGKLEWGTELKRGDAADNLIGLIKHFDANRDSYFAQIEGTKDRLWDVTKKNIMDLKPFLA